MRVLVLDDELLIALHIEQLLVEIGHAVIGPVGTTTGARRLIELGGIDAALLDVNLGNDNSYDIAHLLADKGIPTVFMTGYDPALVNKPFPGTSVLRKPIEAPELARTLTQFAGAA